MRRYDYKNRIGKNEYRGTKKILIIDDDREFTDLLNPALKMHKGYEVRVENNSRNAVEIAHKFKPDIVILDVVMPEIDGGDVHMLFKTDTVLKHTPIIFLTSMVEQSEVEARNGLIGGSRYVAKPVNVPTLIKAISEYLGP
jgi:two-component system OmpR family response regulator